MTDNVDIKTNHSLKSLKEVYGALNKYVIYTDQYGDEAVYILRAYRCYKNHHGKVEHCAELESLKSNSRVTVGLEKIRLADSDTMLTMMRGKIIS